MKKEETKIEENIEEVEVNEEGKLVEVKPTLRERISLGVKKHGKKVATGAAIAAAFTLGIILGGKSSNDSDSYDSDDIIDGEYTEVDSEEE